MRRLLFIALGLVSLSLSAQEAHLTADANFLTRGEVRAGGLPSSDSFDPKTAAFILERTLFGAGYDKAGLSSRITAQHSGTWGSSESKSFNIYEAWVQFRSKGGTFVKIGRQNLSYDDQRIFGADNWAMTAMSHDVLKAGYEGHGHKIHLFAAYNQNLSGLNGDDYFTGGIQPYKNMEAAWYHYDIPKTKLGASLLFMNVGMQGGDKGVNPEVFYQQLFGTYLTYKPKYLVAEAACYFQKGREENGLPLDAWMLSGKVTAKPSSQWSVYIGYDHLSGDEYFATPPKGQIGVTQHKVVKGFSSLYGSHHKFYGAMDFFYVTTYVNGFTPGLQNAFIGARWTPKEKYFVDASYHFLAIATKLEAADSPLGHEVEFSAGVNLGKEARLSTGYSFMRGTKTMEILKKTSGERELHWGWLMLTVTPRFTR